MARAAVDEAKRRGRSRQGEGEQLRRELIAAADKLLAEAGEAEAVSLRAVAREVGVAAPSVYLHFAGKEALLAAVADEHFAALTAAIEAAIAREVTAPRRLLAGCLAYCRFAGEQPGAYRILFGLRRAKGDRSAGSGPAGTAAFQTLVDAIAACMAAGAAPAGDPFRVASAVWPTLHGLVSLRRSRPDFAWPLLEDQVADTLVGLVGVSREALGSAADRPG